MDNLDFLNNIFDLSILLKIPLLLLIFGYTVFSFVIFVQVHSLNKVVKQTIASFVIEAIAILNVFIGLILFFLALVIL